MLRKFTSLRRRLNTLALKCRKIREAEWVALASESWRLEQRYAIGKVWQNCWKIITLKRERSRCILFIFNFLFTATVLHYKPLRVNNFNPVIVVIICIDYILTSRLQYLYQHVIIYWQLYPKLQRLLWNRNYQKIQRFLTIWNLCQDLDAFSRQSENSKTTKVLGEFKNLYNTLSLVFNSRPVKERTGQENRGESLILANDCQISKTANIPSLFPGEDRGERIKRGGGRRNRMKIASSISTESNYTVAGLKIEGTAPSFGNIAAARAKPSCRAFPRRISSERKWESEREEGKRDSGRKETKEKIEESTFLNVFSSTGTSYFPVALEMAKASVSSRATRQITPRGR